MKFGILYNTEFYPELHGSASRYYGQILEQTELAERLGFAAVWFGEHHYSGYSFGSPPVMIMAAAARTKRIRLGTGISLVPLHHPIRLAEEYAMLDVLTGGRLEYGIGRGFLKYGYNLFGIEEDESYARYYEGTDVILKAWTADGPFSHEGTYWRLTDYSFFPRPVQQPHPPVYASGVLTPESFAWAGQRGLHLSTALFLPAREQMRANIELYRESLRASGHDPATRDIGGVFQMYCGESNEEARRNGAAHAFNYFRFFGTLDRRAPHAKESQDYARYRGGISRVFEGASYEAFEQGRLLMIGDPETLIERIRWAEDYYGVNYLIFEVAQGGAPHDLVMRSLERFAQHVMPAFETAAETAEPTAGATG